MEPKRILIADDDRELVRVLDVRCRQLGLRTIVAHDAIDALTLARREQPDLVCLDVNMPLGNGLSVCEMLAGDERVASIPVVMLTGRTDNETIFRCHAMCAYYVLKSNNVWQRLRSVLCELLDLESPEPETPSAPKSSDPPPCGLATSTRSLHHLMAAMAREVVYAQVADTSEEAVGG